MRTRAPSLPPLRFISGLALAAVLSFAAPEQAAAEGTLTKPPALTRQGEATYPPEARNAGLTGKVLLELDLSAEGKVSQARVVESAGHGFDEAALEAVRQFEFSPAEVDGKPATVRIQYAYQFLTGQKAAVNFAGTLLERGTRRPLVGASIAVIVPEGPPLEAHSGEGGKFEVAGVPLGGWKVVVAASDYARYEVEERFSEGKLTQVTYFVRREVYGSFETIVRTRRERKEVSEVSLQQEEIRLVPGTQGDALRVVQNLPGVARAPFSLGQLVVRGGEAYDTRAYVDDITIPQLFHFGGLYATFNSNLVEEISFQPGNFSAEYGRSTGGLVRARTRSPSSQGFHGYADVNLIDASFLVEGPIGKGWSASASARRSYIDLLLPLAVDDSKLSFTLAPRYYDYQVRAEYRPPGTRDRLTLSFFGSRDELGLAVANPTFDAEGRATLRTLITYNRLSAEWVKQLSPRARFQSQNAIGFDAFQFGLGSDIQGKADGWVGQLRQAFHLDFPRQRLQLATGVDLQVQPYRVSVQAPRIPRLDQIPDPFASRTLVLDQSTVWQTEPALFAEAVWTPVKPLKLVPGLRADYNFLLDTGWVDPRLAAFYSVTPTFTLKGAAGLYHQPPDLRGGALSPVFGNPDLSPERSQHYSVGFEKLFTQALSLQVTAYYKGFSQLATLSPASTDPNSSDPPYASIGRGRSRGVELLLRHSLTRRFFGWISYGLSRSERLDPTTGRRVRFNLDQPHNFIGVASYKLPANFILGTRVRYSSGTLDTPIVGAIYDANANSYVGLPGTLYSRRLPNFFAMDLRLDKRFVFRSWILTLYADVQNVTNRRNVEASSYNFNFTQRAYIRGLPILPSLGVRGDF